MLNITNQENAAQTIMWYYLTSVRIVIIKKTRNSKCWPGNIELFISLASGYVSKESKNINLKRHMHPHVHCSMIYNSQDIGTTWESSYGGRMDKECGVYLYNGILFSHEKKILPFVTPLMDLEDIVLSKLSQKMTNHMISFICRI